MQVVFVYENRFSNHYITIPFLGGIKISEFNKASKLKKCIWLMGINLFISTFTIGGGYVIVPMMKKYYVEKKKLFTEEELMEMSAVAQSTPGAIAINLISIVGYKVCGVLGVVISCIAAITPPIIILSIISVFYSAFISNTIISAVLKGMQAGVSALIVDFIIDMLRMISRERSPLLYIIVAISFVISFFTNVNVILIILGGSVISVLNIIIRKKLKKRKLNKDDKKRK